MHAAQKGIDSLGGLFQRDMALPALLILAAEARMQVLQARERGQRSRDIAEQALARAEAGT